VISAAVAKDHILDGLRGLEPSRWLEILDFIGYLKASRQRAQPAAQELTARDLSQSNLLGLCR